MSANTSIEWTDVLKARFWAYVEQRGEDECWPWMAGRFADGMRYGQFRAGARKVKAHRAAFELKRGPIPFGMRVLHKCDNPICCNTSHHFLGTDADNAADRSAKGRSARIVIPPKPADANPAAKLCWDSVRMIRQAYAAGTGPTSIARRFDISPSQVRNIVNGRCWKDAA